MLTSGQCVIAAYLTDGGLVCPDCARKDDSLFHDDSDENRVETEKGTEAAIIQYTLDSEFCESGAFCDDCGEVLIEPDPVEDEEEDEDEDEEAE